MSNLTLDVGLANKLKVAFARNGWTPELIDAACEGDKLGQFRKVLIGHAVINPVEYVIDCDVEPAPVEGCYVSEHQKGGTFKWDKQAQEDGLYFPLLPGSKDSVTGGALQKAVKALPVLNANVLDYLLANPHLIPEKWKGKDVFFWGTIYKDKKDSQEYVRCLLCRDGFLHSGRRTLGYVSWKDIEPSYWVDGLWDVNSPLAIRAG